MNTMGKLLILLTGSLCLYLLVAVLNVLYKYLWIPYRIQFILNSQGIKGPPYEFIHGNNKATIEMKRVALSKPMALTHEIFPRVHPHTYSWINTYGKNYLVWVGVRAQLVITESELVKEVLKNSEKAFPKMKVTYFLGHHLFKPERFAEGIAKATKNNAAAFIPFGLGPRSCVGMSFAIIETKIALSMILQRYTITLSPAYVHSPLALLTLQPQHGIQLLFHSLHNDA